MKKIIASLLLMSSAISMNAAVNVNRIEPTDWYVGMKDASLQLMVYGKDIKNADVTVDYPGVKVDSIARLDSPNYLLVYLNLDGAKAGEMTLNFKQGKQSKKVKYVLKNREMMNFLEMHGHSFPQVTDPEILEQARTIGDTMPEWPADGSVSLQDGYILVHI